MSETAIQGSRMLLETILAAKPAQRPQRHDPVKSAMEVLIATLAHLPTPKIPVEPLPGDIQDMNIHIFDFAKAVDAYFRVLGEHLQANATCKVDMSCFTGVFSGAVEGMASYEVNRAADVLRDDLHEAMR